jgi:hypothetical protein
MSFLYAHVKLQRHFKINSQLNSEELLGRLSSLKYKMLTEEQHVTTVFRAQE